GQPSRIVGARGRAYGRLRVIIAISLRYKPDLIALVALAGIILAVFGAPIVLGLSWFPMPHNPFSPIQEDYSGRTPAYPVGVDDFSFPHFDWPARIVAKEAHLAGELPL